MLRSLLEQGKIFNKYQEHMSTKISNRDLCFITMVGTAEKEKIFSGIFSLIGFYLPDTCEMCSRKAFPNHFPSNHVTLKTIFIHFPGVLYSKSILSGKYKLST